MAERDTQEMTVSIEDPETGAKIQYRVPADIGYSVSKLLEAVDLLRSPGPSWDAACRVMERR